MKFLITYNQNGKEFTKEVEGDIVDGEVKIPITNNTNEDFKITKVELK